MFSAVITRGSSPSCHMLWDCSVLSSDSMSLPRPPKDLGTLCVIAVSGLLLRLTRNLQPRPHSGRPCPSRACAFLPRDCQHTGRVDSLTRNRYPPSGSPGYERNLSVQKRNVTMTLFCKRQKSSPVFLKTGPNRRISLTTCMGLVSTTYQNLCLPGNVSFLQLSLVPTRFPASLYGSKTTEPVLGRSLASQVLRAIFC